MLTNDNDNRHYRHVELANGLRGILIEDHDCDYAAVAATVANGHFNDPRECLGLSHLLEHLLFQGNVKFPTADEFSNFLGLHSGYLNAASGSEYSNYYFAVLNEKLADSLQHFAAMLFEPLFSLESIEQEINIIDAEYRLKVKDDLRRLYQVHKETSNPDHPFSQFSVGNKQTLGKLPLTDLQTNLQSMHHKWYVPSNICICIISSQPLALSATLFEQSFSSATSRCPPPLTTYPELYRDTQLGVKINIQPLSDSKRLIVSFALPNVKSHYRGKPLSLISDLLGDEGPSGLLSYLKQQSLATNLSAGGGIEGRNFRDFNVNFQLTEKGTTQVTPILNALFYFLELIKRQDSLAWRFAEKQKLNQQIWNFADAAKLTDEAIGIANAMFCYPNEHVLCAEYILDQPDTQGVKTLLGYFCPSNMRIKLIHPKVKTDSKASWYHTPYSISSLDNTLLRALNAPHHVDTLALPQANPYLADVYDQVPVDTRYVLPQKIINTEQVEVWYGQDDKFNYPRGDCYVSFDCAATSQGLTTATAKKLWIALINETLHKKYYQANVAGLHLHLYSHQCGFTLHTNGFSAKQLSFCSDIIKQVEDLDNFELNIEQVKQQQLQSLRNNLLNKPINRLFSRLAVLMQQNSYTPRNQAQCMAQVNVEQIRDAKQALLESFHVDILTYGNWRLEEAEQFSQNMLGFAANYKVNQRLSRAIVNLCQRPTQLYKLNCEHPDSAVVIYYQAPSASYRDTILSIMTEQLLAPAFFNFARNEQQLGYLVGSGYVPYNLHPGISLYIQSPTYSAQQLITSIHSFICQLANNLSTFAADWADIKQGVAKQLSANDPNLSMKCQRLWSAIGSRVPNFQQNQAMLAQLGKLSFADLQQFISNLSAKVGFGELILYSDPNLIIGKEMAAENVDDIDLFKKQAQLVD